MSSKSAGWHPGILDLSDIQNIKIFQFTLTWNQKNASNPDIKEAGKYGW